MEIELTHIFSCKQLDTWWKHQIWTCLDRAWSHPLFQSTTCPSVQITKNASKRPSVLFRLINPCHPPHKPKHGAELYYTCPSMNETRRVSRITRNWCPLVNIKTVREERIKNLRSISVTSTTCMATTQKFQFCRMKFRWHVPCMILVRSQI